MKTFRRCPHWILALLMVAPGLVTVPEVEAARLKDVVEIEGVRDNPLTGFGLVVGLNGSGDSSAAFTNQSLKMMLERMGISADQQVKVKNVASVMVTATLPPFARQGSKLDVMISSLGDAKTLQGGTLILTPLKGADGRIYAVAQGPLIVGGFSAGGGGASQQKNHPTVGRISAGATVEKEIEFELNKEQQLQLSLRNPDFTTANRIVQSINDVFGKPLASARDSGTIALVIPPDYQGKVVNFVSRLESVQIDPDQRARVVLNERTGTIVMGENVRVSTVALAHGGLSIKIREEPRVSQPNARSQGATVVTPGGAVSAEEKDARVLEMPEGVTLGDLVRGLNGVGVTPRDLIAILQSIKAAGALQADLEIL
ncbi:Flagellar P-ring protein [Candidatus Magnetaquicoccaceae bacterium FCR-1]|uniref:Flagellar P-ring protein n=1 Tax=Candidatus Magnetaquiglobus chichijimensis TaxID=3141448 RepID=A0ABQ0C7J5_9PROT